MNPYKVLGIRPNASLDEIKDAYESLANTYSINNFNGSPEEPLAEDKISEINEAYSTLTNNFKYKNIRNLIENKQFLSAETELNLISDKTSPEWNYLQGFVLLKKGWFNAGVNHLKTAAELNPNNEEYQEALMILVKKVRKMKANYARSMQYNSANNNNNMCGGNGGGQTNNMCGGSGNGGGIDPNILNMFMNANGGNPMGGANPMNGANPMSGANPTNGMNSTNNTNPMGNIANMMNGMGGMGGGNPMQNMLMQSLMSGGNGMNMCGNSGGGGMC